MWANYGGVYYEWVMQGFTDLGYVPGKNVLFEERYPDEQPERFKALAEDLVRIKVDVVLAISLHSALACQRATSSIPIVFLPILDPVAAGLVATLARPGGNLTGLSSMGYDVVSKRVQLFREAVPKLSRIALLLNSPTAKETERQVQEYVVPAKAFDMTVVPVECRDADRLEAAFAEIKERGFDGAIISQTPMYFIEAKRIAKLARKHELPTLAPADQFVTIGALMSYAAEWRPLYTGAAAYVKRILNGESPAEIPVQQPTKFELVINLATAKAIGLELSPAFVARADRVIE
ncbi:ABC transporter substrate-binding protein [Bradyrhizobium sp. CCGUVB23]|uniref:ABC transporter substrate-binding protein n=1 Tax=Bradyrhizobium sp. CCGUVB23 TaxID=2949630 RepID=UPI0020B3828E|nr:ABC transporter substrate-binding protein [Bradyrhizobium sp. CCGUVB23]MCP3462623.1 ABC transporter substrate-binding protein [Bradyrhizobium sp. CCGUVB23]